MGARIRDGQPPDGATLTRPCGSRHNDKRFGPKVDLAGKRFGRLIAVAWAGTGRWMCMCDCGSEIAVATNSLTHGNTRSCGCLASDQLRDRNTKHGFCGTRIYGIWNRMRQRCSDSNATDYERYGGRGIRVCAEWNDFRIFYEWAMANGYRDDLTIDRTDNDGNYNPDNCRWATRRQQANNKRNSRRITFHGKTKTLAGWSRALAIDHSLLRYRLARWDIERAFITPVGGAR